VVLAVKTGAVAMPCALVVAVLTFPAKVPPAPLAGALNVTVAPATVLPYASTTVAANCVAKAVFTVADCGVPAVAVIDAGAPALLVSANPGLVVRAFATAVTVYLPAISLAVNTCEVATPAPLVIAVFPEQAKVPLAPLVGASNATNTPETGSPEASFTVATNASANALATVRSAAYRRSR
jgi:hypothetical protein